MLKQSEETSALDTALIKARKAMGKGVAKDAKNPFYKSKYATFPAVLDVALDHLLENDVLLTILPRGVENGYMGVTAQVIHGPTGQYRSTTMEIAMGDAPTAQETGKIITYASRYLTQSMLALPSTDDDAQSNNSMTQALIGKALDEIAKIDNEADLEKWGKNNYAQISKHGAHAEERVNQAFMAKMDLLRNK